LIDDGSTDKSLELLQIWENKDSRFKVVHQENKGAGMARNKGLDNANGEYVVFIDSDDIISPNYLERLSTHNEDVVFIDVNAVSETRKIIKKEYMSAYKGKSIDDIIRYQMTGTMPWGGVRKAVRLQLLNSYNIRYSNQKNGEEAVYSFLILSKAKSIGYIEEPMYSYILRENSLSSSLDDDPWGGLVEAYLSNALCSSELAGGGYLDTLNSLNLCATAVALDRLATYYSYREYIPKASQRIKKCKSSLISDVGIDYSHLDLKSKIALKLIINESLLGFYIISRLKNLIKWWAR
jgi:glycosyltransferase involved in cell wall biosynthesis